MDTRREQAVLDFLKHSGWMDGLFSDLTLQDVSFLAAGEYNENYLIREGSGPAGAFVFRINHGSQLGLERQIEYEFQVLQSVAASGRTPLPFHVEPKPGLGLGRGVMLMQYLPGRSLRYETDLEQAAEVFAAVHSQPVTGPAQSLLVQADPVLDIAGESLGLLQRYPDHPREQERDLLLAYHDQVLGLARDHDGMFADEAMVITNTEVNSGNFIVHEAKAWLVDWEKAVVSYRYQDLGHFLVPTTTKWKTSFTFSPETRLDFLLLYGERAGLAMSLEELSLRTDILEKTILLRALSWCFMAWYEYTRPGRTLTNNQTFATINSYLDDLEWIVA